MVGETMNRWLEHAERAARWLAEAQEYTDAPKKAANCLYEVIVSVTRAVMELEKSNPDAKKYP